MIKKIIYPFIFTCLFIINAPSITEVNSQNDESSYVWSHGLTLGDNLKYKTKFSNFDYVNPNAPKGGRISQPAIGSFDTLNPFNLKGVAANGSYYIYDTLQARFSLPPGRGRPRRSGTSSRRTAASSAPGRRRGSRTWPRSAPWPWPAPPIREHQTSCSACKDQVS